MVGENIKRLRLQHKMTQKNVADKLFVTVQAVSRWEKGDVEPSISTIVELARIFGVTTDEILGVDQENTANNETNGTDEQQKDSYRPFLALCEQCNSPIYHSNEIIRENKTIFCLQCYEERQQRERENKEKARLENIRKGIKRRKRSFVFGTAGLLLSLIVILSDVEKNFKTPTDAFTSILVSIMFFTFISCCFLNNNFVGYMFIRIATFSIKMPGLIFTFDLEGCLLAIVMKILSFLLGIVLAIIMVIIAIAVGGLVSLFVYPYAIIKNFRDPGGDTYL